MLRPRGKSLEPLKEEPFCGICGKPCETISTPPEVQHTHHECTQRLIAGKGKSQCCMCIPHKGCSESTPPEDPLFDGVAMIEDFPEATKEDVEKELDDIGNCVYEVHKKGTVTTAKYLLINRVRSILSRKEAEAYKQGRESVKMECKGCEMQAEDFIKDLEAEAYKRGREEMRKESERIVMNELHKFDSYYSMMQTQKDYEAGRVAKELSSNILLALKN